MTYSGQRAGCLKKNTIQAMQSVLNYYYYPYYYYYHNPTTTTTTTTTAATSYSSIPERILQKFWSPLYPRFPFSHSVTSRTFGSRQHSRLTSFGRPHKRPFPF